MSSFYDYLLWLPLVGLHIGTMLYGYRFLLKRLDIDRKTADLRRIFYPPLRFAYLHALMKRKNMLAIPIMFSLIAFVITLILLFSFDPNKSPPLQTISEPVPGGYVTLQQCLTQNYKLDDKDACFFYISRCFSKPLDAKYAERCEIFKHN